MLRELNFSLKKTTNKPSKASIVYNKWDRITLTRKEKQREEKLQKITNKEISAKQNLIGIIIKEKQESSKTHLVKRTKGTILSFYTKYKHC